MVMDIQVSRTDFEKYYLPEYHHTFLLGCREKFNKEGEWIRFCNRAIDKAKEIFGSTDDIIIAEVVPKIKPKVVLVYGRSRKKPKPIKAVTFHEIEKPQKSSLFLISKKPLLMEPLVTLLREVWKEVNRNA